MRTVHSLRRPALVILALAAVAAALAIALTRGGPAAAATPPDDGRSVQVAGTAEVEVAPDRAILAVGVEHDASGAEATRSAGAADLAAVLDALRAAGVAPDHLQSDGLQVEPRYSDQNETRITGYRAQASVNVTLDDLDRVGPVIDAATASGAARVEGVTWTLRDPGRARREALGRAAADGRAQAEALAQGAGVALGSLQSMAVSDGNAPVPVESAVKAAAPGASTATPTPVAPGTLSASVSVTMTFALVG